MGPVVLSQRSISLPHSRHAATPCEGHAEWNHVTLYLAPQCAQFEFSWGCIPTPGRGTMPSSAPLALRSVKRLGPNAAIAHSLRCSTMARSLN